MSEEKDSTNKQVLVTILAIMTFVSPLLSMIIYDYFSDAISFGDEIFPISTWSGVIFWMFAMLIIVGIQTEKVDSE